MNVKFYLLGLIAGSLSLTNCSKEELTESGANSFQKEYTATFVSGDVVNNGTRTAYDPQMHGIHFKDKENLSAFIWDNNNALANSPEAAIRTAGDPAHITVNYTAAADATDHNFLFIHPFADNYDFKVAEQKLHFRLKKNQNPGNNLFDTTQDYVISQAINKKTTATPEDLSPVMFTRLFTFLKFKIDCSQAGNTGINATGKVQRVILKSTGSELTCKNLVLNLSDMSITPGIENDKPVTWFDSAEAVYTNRPFENGIVEVCFVVNPTTLDNFTLTIETDKQTIVEKRQVNWNLESNKLYCVDVKATSITNKDLSTYDKIGVEIDGTTYNDQSTGFRTYKSGETIQPSEGVAFINGDVITADASRSVSGDLVIIGNDPSKPSKITFKQGKGINYWALRNRGGKIIFKNVIIDASELNTGDKLFECSNATGGIGTFYFEDCFIKLPSITSKDGTKTKPMQLFAFSKTATEKEHIPGRIIVKNSVIELNTEGCNAEFNLFQMQGTKIQDCSNFKEFTFTNNKIYCTTTVEKHNGLLRLEDNAKADNLALTLSNNIIVDCGCYMGLFRMGASVKSLVANENILYNNAKKDIAVIGFKTIYKPANPLIADAATCKNQAYAEQEKEPGQPYIWRMAQTGQDDICPQNNQLPQANPAPLTIVDQKTGNFTVTAQGNYGPKKK